MSMSPEWKRRVGHWVSVMERLVYVPEGKISFEGFVTKDFLSPDEALKKRFKAMPPGAKWGAKWEYGWFRGSLTVPKSLAGKRVAMRVDVGGEAAIFVNGSSSGANDIGHKEVTLTRKAKGGEKFEIMAESYAGHGPRVCGGGPVPHGEASVPEPGETQVEVGESTFGVWEEELYQLLFDAKTLFMLRDTISDENSLRVSEIDDALKKMTLAVDLELPRPEMMKTVAEGRKILRPLLECKNGSTSPLMSCFGHSHIDVAWLWPLAETERKCRRTFSSQLALMEEYPEYLFLQSQAHLYMMVKKRFPDLYERVKKAVKKGQWIVDGGMWVEPDTNVTGGESLIRQFAHGKKFFRDEFGVESELMWLPDVFGYSGALPQIMLGCGIKYFSTQKIFWTYNGGDPFPYNIFHWEGIDGSRALAYLHNDYNSQTSPDAVAKRWSERVQRDAFHNTRLMPFGWGDGGGGPTREHLEYLRREENLEGLPRCAVRPPAEFFKEMKTDGIPVWVGELYFQAHRGTYTSQAKTKKGNRLSEINLREAELWGALASRAAKHKYPAGELDSLWKDVLLNQFHDILPGSSIHRVYEEAEASLANVVEKASGLASAARAKLARKDSSCLTFFNSLSWERGALAEIPSGVNALETENGDVLPAQKHNGKNFALVKGIPSCGALPLKKSAKKAPPAKELKVSAAGLENELVKVSLNKNGEITEFVDKASGVNFAAGVCNQMKMFKDVPGWFDAWDIDSMYKLQPVSLDAPAKIKVTAEGPLFAAVQVERMLHDSMMIQEIVLTAGSKRLDFRTKIDWKESHKLLKVCFPVAVKTEDALHEIQFGHLKRPTHATRPYDAARFEVCNQRWTALAEPSRGAAVLNDSKYGVNVEGSSINLTLLKAALAPDMTADKGEQEFVYSFYCWDGLFAESGLIRQGYELNTPVSVTEGFAEKQSLLSVDSEHIIIETVKAADDGSGDIIVRLYESLGSAESAALSCALPVTAVSETDMLENFKGKLNMTKSGVKLEFRPFEIKTLRLKA